MDRFDEELRAGLRRAAQRPGALPEWGAVQARASVLRQRRNALRAAPVAASLLIAGVALALSVNRAPARVDVGSPGSVTTLTTVAESVVTTSTVPVTSTSVPPNTAASTSVPPNTAASTAESSVAESSVAESDDSIPSDDESDVSSVSAPPGSTPRSSIPRSTSTSTSSPSSTQPSTRSASCFGGTISVRISPAFGLISIEPKAPTFWVEEQEHRTDEVKVRFGDGQRECTVRVRSDGRVNSGDGASG